jgi:ABC-type Fe3+ transport system permease subunit
VLLTTGRGGLLDIALASVLFSALYVLSYEALPPSEAEFFAYIIWLASFLYGYIALLIGFDFNRIRYSSSLTFIVTVLALYEIIVLFIGAAGVLRLLAVAFAPLVGVAFIGALQEWLRELRSSRVVTKSLREKIASAFYQLDRTMWFFFTFGFAYLAVFMIIPLLLVLVYSFIPPAGGSWWDNFYTILRTRSYVNLNPIYVEPVKKFTLPSGECIYILKGVNYGPVLNSIIVASIVTACATALGVVVAYILARYRFPGHTFFRILAVIPLFNTPFINAYVIRLLWSEHGPVSAVVKALAGCSLRVEGLAGVIIAQIFTFYPIVYLNAYTAFINVDPSMEEQAENLGARGFKLFRSVTLPLALPGITAGSILVFVFSLEDLGAPIVFNERELMSMRIFNGLITSYGMIHPEIAALGVVMLVFALVAFIAIRNYVSMRSYAMISRGGRWNPRIKRLGPLGSALIYGVVIPFILFTALPQIGVLLMSFDVMKPFAREAGLVLTAPERPLYYFTRVFIDPSIYRYIVNTLVYAGVAVAIATFLATCIAYSVSRVKIKSATNMLDSLSVAPLAIPGLVFAIGYYIFFGGLSTILPGELGARLNPANVEGFEAWLVFIIAYSVRRLPYVVRSVFAGFQQVHENLEEAALNLGASRLKVVFGVILPLIIGYILSGSLIGFIYMVTEVSTSVTFGGIRNELAPLTYFMKEYYATFAGLGPQVVAVIGTILILIQLAVVITVVYVFKQRYAFISI